ncbi:MAG: regulatory protein RecX [Geobacteraceae bacterium]
MEDARKAFDCAIGLLARRDHGVAEIERKLVVRGFSEPVVAEVIGRLTVAGYLDDRRFAGQWAEWAVRNGKGYGPRLSLELARRGVKVEIIAEVLADIRANHDEEETLAELAARKFAGFDFSQASDRERRRVVNYLVRRGFSTSIILDYLRNKANS